MSGFVRLNKRVTKAPPTTTYINTTTPTALPLTSQQQQKPQQPQQPPQPTPSTMQQDLSKMGTGGTIMQPVMASAQAKAQQRLLSKVAAVAQISIPNGCKPWVSNQFLTPTGIKDLDVILGGGLPLHTLNSIISDSRTNHSDVFTKAHLWEGHLRKQRCILLTTRPDYQSVRFSQEILRPALVNQKTKTAPNTTTNQSGTTSNPSTTTISTPKKVSIDDEEDSFTRRPKPTTQPTTPSQPALTTKGNSESTKRITQGSIQDALHDGTNAKLTIAWQYDKYSGKTMDDSNLSGVNDDDHIISDRESDDGSDNEGVGRNIDSCDDDNTISSINSTNKTVSNIFDQSSAQKDQFATQYDFHIINPHPLNNSTLNQQQPCQTNTSDNIRFTGSFPHFNSSLQPQFHRHALLTQLISVVNLPPSTNIHFKHSEPLTDDQRQQQPPIPSRIVIELSAELLRHYPTTTTTLTTSPDNKYQCISVAQFFYALLSLVSATPSIITLLVPATVANNPQTYALLASLSQLLLSMASFSSQVTLSNQTILQSQLGSAYNLFGDKHDGLLTIHRLPRLNTPSYSYKLPDSTLFLYRLKKQLTATLSSTSTTTVPTLGIAKLVLPPEVSRSGDAHNSTGSGGTPKDLFDEAIVEITRKQQLSMADASNNASPQMPTKRLESNGQQQSCPTCGSATNEHPNSTPDSNKFALGSKTAKQQQELNEKHSQMIIEENEDEDTEE